jgi:hypothetical protein
MAAIGITALIALAPTIGIATWAICRAGDRPTPRPGTLNQAAEEGQ